MALVSPEEIKKIILYLAEEYTGLDLDPADYDAIADYATNEYNRYEQAEQKKGSLKKSYAKHRAKKAARKIVKKAIKKQLAKKAAAQAAKTGARTAGRAAAVAGAGESFGITLLAWLAVELVINAVKFIRHPIEESKKWGNRGLYIGLGVFAFFMLMYLMVMTIVSPLLEEAKRRATEEAKAAINITKTAPDVQNDQEITYTITVTAQTAVSDVIVTDPLPEFTRFVSASGKVTCEGKECGPTSKIVVWKASENNLTAPFQTTITLKVKPVVANKYFVNIASGLVTSTTAPNTNFQGYVPPAGEDSCQFMYAINTQDNWLLPKNFGDPACNYLKDAQYEFLKKNDPEFADLWFLTITEGESSYNPNAWAPPVGEQATIDSGGAWGLYQMGSSTPPGQAPPARGKNGEFDRGDVNWEVQTLNAINYNRARNCNFAYWATARAFWYKHSC